MMMTTEMMLLWMKMENLREIRKMKNWERKSRLR
uniref:Uncharacterized protein MANES_06G036600 n=1 Tax=Rhizophora mucronata TaxID=61149 RepID=A0A2P2QFX5_RHIMU